MTSVGVWWMRVPIWMSFMLLEQGTTGSIDVSAQAHLDNVSQTSSLVTLTGQAWAQGAPLLAVEYRVNGGEWRSATFDANLGDLASLERLTWTVALDPSAFGTGDLSRGSGAHRRWRLPEQLASFTGSAAGTGTTGALRS